MKNLTDQPKTFSIKFLTNLCISLQLAYLVPEEMSAFFDGELSFPIEDTTADAIDHLDSILYTLPSLPDESLENFKA